MTRTNRPRSASSPARVILHRDGTVTMWSCARQSWERGIPSDSDLAECDHATAARIARHTGRDHLAGVQ